MAVERRYDFPEFGGYPGNVGWMCRTPSGGRTGPEPRPSGDAGQGGPTLRHGVRWPNKPPRCLTPSSPSSEEASISEGACRRLREDHRQSGQQGDHDANGQTVLGPKPEVVPPVPNLVPVAFHCAAPVTHCPEQDTLPAAWSSYCTTCVKYMDPFRSSSNSWPSPHAGRFRGSSKAQNQYRSRGQHS